MLETSGRMSPSKVTSSQVAFCVFTVVPLGACKVRKARLVGSMVAGLNDKPACKSEVLGGLEVSWSRHYGLLAVQVGMLPRKVTPSLGGGEPARPTLSGQAVPSGEIIRVRSRGRAGDPP